MAEPVEQNLCEHCRTPNAPGARHCVHCGTPMLRKPAGYRPRNWWPWTRWIVLHKILHIEDTPHRIALGLALGMFVAFTPTFGLQMIIVFALAWILRANKVVGLVPVWITNLATIAPIYYFCYWLGERVLGPGGATLAHFQKLTELSYTGNGWWADTVAYTRHAWGLIWVVFWRCWLGSLVIGAVTGLLTYLGSYYGIIAYRAAHAKRFPGSRFDANGRPLRRSRKDQAE